MNIGFVVVSDGIGGVEKRFARLFNRLMEHSTHNVTLLVPSGLYSQLCEQGILVQNHSNVIQLFHSPLYSSFNYVKKVNLFGHRVRGLGRLLTPLWRKEWNSNRIQAVLDGFDVIHFCNNHPLLVLPKDQPVVLEEPDSSSQSSISQSVISWIDQGAFVSCLSASIRAAYFEEIRDPAKRERIYVAPCSFIDYDKTFIAPKERLIVFAGRLEKAKNPELFVHAIEILAKQRQDFTAILLGTGTLDRKVDTLIMRKGLSSIMLRQFHSRPQEILSRALIFVSIQEFDNYPSQALIEAMACGCAVLASDTGETGRLVSDDVGYRVPLLAEEIAAKLFHALENFSETVELGKSARKKVMQEHTADRYVDYLECLYQRAISVSQPVH